MPAVCRGDSTDKDIVHCALPLRDERSDDVKVNGIGISRQGDKNTPFLSYIPRKRPQLFLFHVKLF